jgi:hypothetical protein
MKQERISLMSLRHWLALGLVIVFVCAILFLSAPDPFASLSAEPGAAPHRDRIRACLIQGGRWDVTWDECRTN